MTINLDTSAARKLIGLLAPTWTGGPPPDEGLVLVDAGILRAMVRTADVTRVRCELAESRLADVARWSGLDEGDIDDDEAIGKALHERLLQMEARAKNAEDASFKLIDQVMGQQRDEASLRKRWAALGTLHSNERKRRQELEAQVDLLTLYRDRWEKRCNEARKELARMRAVAAMGDDTKNALTECWCEGAQVGHPLAPECSEMTPEERARAPDPMVLSASGTRERPTVLTMSGEMGGADCYEMDMGGDWPAYDLARLDQALGEGWVQRLRFCPAPTPEAP